MRRLLLLALVPLVACGTPQERCVRSVTKDVRVLDRLIATSRGNLERGYAYETQGYYDTEYRICGYTTIKKDKLRPIWCLEDVWTTRRVRVAINLDDEAATLKTMEVRRAEMAHEAQPAIAECAALHPE